MEEKSEKGRHNALSMFIVILTVVVYVVVITFNYLSSSPVARGLFLNSTGDISDLYFLEITPAGWTFGVVWGTIYLLNAAGLIYCLTTLFRKGPDGEYLYVSPPMTPRLMYVSLMLNLFSNVTWLFLWDRQHIIICLVPIALAAFFLYCAIFFTARPTCANAQDFYTSGRQAEYWLVTSLVHNSLAFYASWLTIATLLNFAMVLTYKAGVEMQTSCTVVLAVLCVEVVVWFILDVTVLDKYVRYVVSPYVLLLLGLGGSMYKNWNPTQTNSIFTAVLFGLFAVFGIVKVALLIWRHCRRPIAVSVA